MSCQDGHSPRHEPFEVGNRVAERHGAYSERRIGPLAEQIETDLIEAAPWLARPCFAWARRRAAREEARATLAWAAISEKGALDDEDQPTPASNAYDRWSASAARRFAACGLDLPTLSNAIRTVAAVHSMTGDQSETLELLIAEGRAALAAGAEHHRENDP